MLAVDQVEHSATECQAFQSDEWSSNRESVDLREPRINLVIDSTDITYPRKVTFVCQSFAIKARCPS